MARIVFGVKVLSNNMRLLMFDKNRLYPDICAEKDYYSDSESETEISLPGPYYKLNNYRPESIFDYQILSELDGNYVISLHDIHTGHMSSSSSSKHQTKLFPEQAIAYCAFINKLKENGRLIDTCIQMHRVD